MERNSFERSSLEVPTSPIAPQPERQSHESPTQGDSPYDVVVRSDIGIETLLNRLKQSVASARDFASFLKSRSDVEEKHAQSLKKLSRTTSESIRRPESRQGSFARGYAEISRIQERMADNGIQFALSLHQMHEDLQELATDKELGRKDWKHKSLFWEKRVTDANSAHEKAKSKYMSLAEDYDRARTGERQSGRFGIKGPKSAAQVEEDLQRRMQAADADYQQKVATHEQLYEELEKSLRPEAVKAIEYLIHECDAGLSLQMQKFATFHEKLLLSNGLCINPVKGEGGAQSLREIVQGINNEQDLKNHIAGFSSRATKQAPLGYKPHHTQAPVGQISAPMSQHTPPQQQQQYPPANAAFISQPPTNQGYPPQSQYPPQQPHIQGQAPQQPSVQVPRGPNGFHQQQQLQSPSTPTAYNHGGSTNSLPYHEPPNQYGGPPPLAGARDNGDYGIHNAPPTHPVQQQQYPPPSPYAASSQHAPSPRGPNTTAYNNSPAPVKQAEPELPPTKPVFGLTLEDLFARDGSAVPMVIYQCLQAVDLFGLDVEGIYRTNGNAVHIQKLRALFNNNSEAVDFRNPEAFYHDVNSVAGVLKQFFRDLPDPLFTREHYQGFIDAARIDDDIARRDSLHAEINNLPDPNYATLRALTLHLHRVQEHSASNRMNTGNLAICFGPTLMVGSGVPAIADAGWQVRAVDTILQNAYSIFDED